MVNHDRQEVMALRGADSNVRFLKHLELKIHALCWYRLAVHALRGQRYIFSIYNHLQNLKI